MSDLVVIESTIRWRLLKCVPSSLRWKESI